MKRFILFAGVGGVATLLQFALLALMIETQLLPEVWASAVSDFFSSVFNYLAKYHLTFTSSAKHRHTLPKFAATAGLGLCVNTLLFALFFFLVKQYLVAQCLATGLTLILNFLAHKFWIYRNH